MYVCMYVYIYIYIYIWGAVTVGFALASRLTEYCFDKVQWSYCIVYCILYSIA